MEALGDELKEVKQRIKVLEEDILELRDRIKRLGEGAPDHMRKELEGLQEEKNLLLAKENLLLAKENLLSEEKILLLRQGRKLVFCRCVILDTGAC